MKNAAGSVARPADTKRSTAAIQERVGDGTTNPDSEYAVRLTCAVVGDRKVIEPGLIELGYLVSIMDSEGNPIP